MQYCYCIHYIIPNILFIHNIYLLYAFNPVIYNESFCTTLSNYYHFTTHTNYHFTTHTDYHFTTRTNYHCTTHTDYLFCLNYHMYLWQFSFDFYHPLSIHPIMFQYYSLLISILSYPFHPLFMFMIIFILPQQYTQYTFIFIVTITLNISFTSINS